MRKIIKRVLCLLMLVATTFFDVGYDVYAAETECKEFLEGNNKYIKESDCYEKHKDERTCEEKIEDAMIKIEKDEWLTDEEIDAINSQYDELEIELPTDKVEWEVDHEKNIGVSEVMLLSTNIKATVYTNGGKTTTSEIAGLSKTAGKLFYTKYSSGSILYYNFYNKIGSSFVMPGMKQTAVKGTTCNKMIPQGITYYDGYLFVTAYCGDGSHNSVIYVLEASTKKYITTLVLKDKYHSGGITYADGYMWISNTEENEKTKVKTGYLCYYNYNDIKAAIKEAVSNTNITSISLETIDNGKITLKSGYIASFVTTYNGYLCVGEFDKSDYDESNDQFKTNAYGRICFYHPTLVLSNYLNPTKVVDVPANAQGINFYTTYNTVYLIINTSNGKKNPSFIHVYTTPSYLQAMSLKRTKTIKMPGMVEEAINYGGYTYFVFESCGYKYSSNSETQYVIGRVCGFSTSFIYK